MKNDILSPLSQKSIYRKSAKSMTLPLFSSNLDPGPDFAGLLGLVGYGNNQLSSFQLSDGMNQAKQFSREGDLPAGVPHGTTIVAVRCKTGVVIAGDRRATEGVSIAHRSIEKVFPADKFSAVAIAGAAGPAIEMVRLFQTQLEHYEKVEGSSLSLEGKANQLGQMVRSHFPLALQGLAVIPLFAGYDTKRSSGRIFSFDVTGGRYEETEFHTTGSGSRSARTTIKLGYKEGFSVEEAIRLCIKALYEAADDDAATGGPDMIRQIFPIVAKVDKDGYEQFSQETVRDHFVSLISEIHPDTK